MKDSTIYADYNATAPLADGVLEAMRPFLAESFGNPSSPYPLGFTANSAIEESRRAVAELAVADEGEIVFTSGGTESCFLALVGAFLGNPARKRFFCSVVEHAAVLEVAPFLARLGVVTERLSVTRSGALNMSELNSSESLADAVVSVMSANNETGVIFKLESFAVQLKARGALLHSDSVQLFGKCPVNFKALGVDLLSLSGHKFGAPKGIGALIVRQGVAWQTPLVGGGQEFGRRGGTPAVSSIVGLGVAARAAVKLVEQQNTVSALRDRLEFRLLELVNKVEINGQELSRLPNTASLTVGGVLAKQLVLALANRKIFVSAGSACSSVKTESSHVLRAMGRSELEALCTIRVSLSYSTTPEEVEALVVALAEEITKIRTQNLGSVRELLR